MSFSAITPIANMDDANAALYELGYGLANFSVPLRTGTEPDASHAGLNCLADMPTFRKAVEALPNVSMQDAPSGTVAFAEHVEQEALDWSDPTNWTENPVMKGDQRTFEGKLWESLVDYNVWTPPVNWREMPTTGYPAWVQPTGATDAYPLGFRVTHKDQNWENTGSNANVWEPGVFGWDALQDG